MLHFPPCESAHLTIITPLPIHELIVMTTTELFSYRRDAIVGKTSVYEPERLIFFCSAAISSIEVKFH